MSRFEKRLNKFMPVIFIGLIVNAVLWALQAGNESSWLTSNVYVSILFIFINLIGAWYVYSIWQKNRQQK